MPRRLRYLLEAVSDQAPVDKEGRTPLFDALEAGHETIINLLCVAPSLVGACHATHQTFWPSCSILVPRRCLARFFFCSALQPMYVFRFNSRNGGRLTVPDGPRRINTFASAGDVRSLSLYVK